MTQIILRKITYLKLGVNIRPLQVNRQLDAFQLNSISTLNKMAVQNCEAQKHVKTLNSES